AQAHNNRGHAHERKLDYDKAIADYDEAIRLDPKYRLAWLNRGRTWQASGKLEKALDDYKAAIRLDPRSPWGYALQASIYSSSADPKYRDGPRAVDLARTACEMGGPANAYLCEVRAAAHEAAGEPDRAAEWRATAREAASKPDDGRTVASRPIVPAGGSGTARPNPAAPGRGDANIGYLSSIPSDYRGAEQAPGSISLGPGIPIPG